jgi:hypothetical protein
LSVPHFVLLRVPLSVRIRVRHHTIVRLPHWIFFAVSHLHGIPQGDTRARGLPYSSTLWVANAYKNPRLWLAKAFLSKRLLFFFASHIVGADFCLAVDQVNLEQVSVHLAILFLSVAYHTLSFWLYSLILGAL